MKSIILSLCALFLLSSCGNKKTIATVLRDKPFGNGSQNYCAENNTNSFVARWESGKITVIQAKSKNDLIENFIKKNLDDLNLVEPNYTIKIKPVDKSRSSSVRNWHHIAVNSLYAWDRGLKGSGVEVAIIDSGVDVNHNQLRDQIAVNENEIPNNLIDDDNNGYVDDYHGYDFYLDQGSMSDQNGHGTHVAGIVSAEHFSNPNSGNDITGSNFAFGIAPEAKIVPIRFLGPQGEGSLAGAVAAIDYAIERQVDIINASWGGSACSQILNDKVLELERHGILFVAAAGNEGIDVDRIPVYPGSIFAPHVVNVGASSSVGALAYFSNFGLYGVDLAAPGVDIYSTTPFNDAENMSGTSMAAPIVAGLAAVLKSINPNISVQDLKNKIRGSVTPSSLKVETRGEIDIRRAVDSM
jgi:subtilisin family serine protease